jgi:DNA-binding NarL/FixJ family response regulator
MVPDITIAIIEDHPFTREGVASWFARSGAGLRVIATGEALRDVHLPPFSTAAVLVLDLNLLAGKVFPSDVAKLATAGRRVVILTEDTRDETYYAMMEAGACAVITKNHAPTECVEAVLHAARGEPYLSRKAAHAIAGAVRAVRPKLSEQELQAVRLTCFGLDQRTVAQRMGIKPETVKTYLTRAYLKYANAKRPVSGRHALTIRALEDGTVTLHELSTHADMNEDIDPSTA